MTHILLPAVIFELLMQCNLFRHVLGHMEDMLNSCKYEDKIKLVLLVVGLVREQNLAAMTPSLFAYYLLQCRSSDSSLHSLHRTTHKHGEAR